MTYEDEIALLAADIRRYSNNDGRIDEALTQLIKLHQAEVDALAFEARELDKALLNASRAIVRETQTVSHWAPTVLDWRGDDFYAGAAPEDRSQM